MTCFYRSRDDINFSRANMVLDRIKSMRHQNNQTRKNRRATGRNPVIFCGILQKRSIIYNELGDEIRRWRHRLLTDETDYRDVSRTSVHAQDVRRKLGFATYAAVQGEGLVQASQRHRKISADAFNGQSSFPQDLGCRRGTGLVTIGYVFLSETGTDLRYGILGHEQCLPA